VVIDARLKSGVLLVTMGNTGNSHYMVNAITVSAVGAGGETVFTRHTGGWYVLAGAQHVFSIPIPESKCAKVEAVKVGLKIDRETLRRTVTVTPASCRPKRQSSTVVNTTGQ
jgi:hypothetical protein